MSITCARSSARQGAGSRRSAAWAIGLPMVEPSPLRPQPPAVPQPAPVDEAEAHASEADARLVRKVRWRLVAWSGGSTLLVLVILGAALYAAAASTLASASIGQLSNRVDPVADALSGRTDVSQEPPDQFGFRLGGGNTFLFAF